MRLQKNTHSKFPPLAAYLPSYTTDCFSGHFQISSRFSFNICLSPFILTRAFSALPAAVEFGAAQKRGRRRRPATPLAGQVMSRVRGRRRQTRATCRQGLGGGAPAKEDELSNNAGQPRDGRRGDSLKQRSRDVGSVRQPGLVSVEGVSEGRWCRPVDTGKTNS